MLAQLILTLREGLEAALIVTILASYLGRIGRKDLIKYLYLGSGLAVLASVLVAALLWTLYGYVEGIASHWFEAFAMFTAASVLTYMILWMAKNSRRIRGELQERVDVAISSGQLLGIALLAFTSVLREGVETTLFLSTAAILALGDTIIGAAIGFAVALLISLLLMRGTLRLDWRKFFMYTSALLILFASGIVMHGAEALQELGILPPVVEHVYDLSAVLPEYSPIGSLIHVFTGYHESPSLLMLLVQLGYLVVFGVYVYRVYRVCPVESQTVKPGSSIREVNKSA